MPTEKSADKFIEFASKLIESNPLVTLSTTYSNESKKINKKRAKKNLGSDGKEPFGLKNTATITFKCFEPRSGQCIKFKTYKAKELSRILAFIGPRGVSVTTKRPSETHSDDKQASKKAKLDTQQMVPGLTSLMSNVAYKEEEVPTPSTNQVADAASPIPEVTQSEPTSAKSKNKKKKKKAKK